MHISGYQSFTLLDYPGKISAVAFTPGCVFRCPFCHNPELIDVHDEVSKKMFLENREEEFFAFLEKRRGKLDGVCITGGEPTLQRDLIDSIGRIKDMGYLCKLDTNGLFPDIVEKILDTELVDYWAVDIKHTPEKYHLAVGKRIDIESICKTVELLMDRAKDYEFRTTVVPSIHEESDFTEIAEWIRGANAYYLQEFREGKLYDLSLAQRVRGAVVSLENIQKIVSPYVKKCEIRR